jgi:propanol-preferring alcohol dehydrogenase
MKMKAQVLRQPAPMDSSPLRYEDVPIPEIGERDLLVKVRACGVCHTDLHVCEGELPNPKFPIVPGHQVVGIVERVGADVTRFQPGARVGVYWLHDADGTCEYCQHGLENLCPNAHFTGYTANGGYAEYVAISEDFAVPLPHGFSDSEVAPLLCAGVVGYRSLKLADIHPGERVGLYGYGASGHICLQVLRHWNCEVCVFTRGESHRQHARELGAVWTGDAQAQPPQRLDRAVIFAPAGWIVPLALSHLRPAGTLCINAIHMSNLPEMPYDRLWQERTIRSVANVTRQDAEEFLPLAAQIPIRTTVETFPLEAANQVLQRLKASQIEGAAVLLV